MSSVLKVEGLSKSFRQIQALNDVSLSIEPGDFVGLIGPNGAGKSTLMNCSLARLVPDAGKVELGGVDVYQKTVAARAKVGFVPQELDLYEYLTGEEYLWFIGELREVPEVRLQKTIKHLLHITELTRARNRIVKEYSGGMSRKLAIAGALVGKPPLLMLDESFVGLDLESTFAIEKELAAHRENGGAVLLSSHILDMLERICTRIVMLVGGELVIDASKAEVDSMIEDEGFCNLTELYLDRADKLERLG